MQVVYVGNVPSLGGCSFYNIVTLNRMVFWVKTKYVFYHLLLVVEKNQLND